MLGIPSPDVVVNLFASLGQLLALLSILVGGAAVSMKRKGRGKKQQETSRGLLYATAGLAVASMVAFGLYYTHVQDLNNARLRANLTRQVGRERQASRNTSLKTLSFSDQMDQPRAGDEGQGPEGRSRIANTPLNIIDIRENEEVEASGMLAGATHIRYPDLKETRKGLRLHGALNLLICYSGNRSSELTEEFVEKRGRHPVQDSWSAVTRSG